MESALQESTPPSSDLFTTEELDNLTAEQLADPAINQKARASLVALSKAKQEQKSSVYQDVREEDCLSPELRKELDESLATDKVVDETLTDNVVTESVIDQTFGNEGGTASGAGANRAAKFAENWQHSSLDDAIEKFAPNANPVTTSSGKILFKNGKTGIQVVYDKNGNYFRIEDTTLAGKRRYLDLNGNNVSNKIVDGKQMGRTKDEYEAITHFLNMK